MHTPGLARRTYADFASRWRLVFAWQLVVQMIGTAAVVPLSGWLLDRVVARSGSPVVSNYDIASFLLSGWGAAFALLLVAAAVTFQLAQFAGYTWIAGHAIGRRPLTLWGTAGAVWKRTGLLARTGLRMTGRLLLLALPFAAAAGVFWYATLRGHDVNYYLAEHPPQWRRAVAVIAALAVAYGCLVLWQAARWTFAMPLVMFDRERSPRAVLAQSERMLDGVLLRSVWPLVAWWFLLGLAAATLFWVGRQFTDAAMEWAGMDVRRVLPLVALFTACTLASGFVYSTLQFAGLQFLATRLYAERRDGTLALPDARDPEVEEAGRRQGRAVVTVLAGLTVLALGIGGVLFGRLDLREDVAVTAHRGASLVAPENSMAAFEAAYEAGADFVELDVQRTRDGQVVVIHDGDLMRMAGDPRRVRDLTLAELEAIDIGSRRGARHAGERVPTLDHVIDYARGRLRLNIELKYNVRDDGLAPAVVELLRRRAYTDQVVITSLDHGALRQVARLAPELTTGLIVTAAVGDVVRTDTDFVSLNAARATPDLVRRAQARGKQVHVWTVNDPDAMLRMIERDVDNVITDDPARLVQLMRQRNGLSTAEQLGLGLRVLFTDAPPELLDPAAVPPL